MNLLPSLVQNLSFMMVFISVVTVYLAIVVTILEKKKNDSLPARQPDESIKRIAFLIASKDGEKTIGNTVAAALKTGHTVFVVSDGSTDNTAEVAKEAGAQVLKLENNIGKPSALHLAYKHFLLYWLFDAIAILDDDVTVDDEFLNECKQSMYEGVAITVGRNITEWPKENNWNIWIASRAYSYWVYQATLRRVQSGINVMNCISGSNSLYRTSVLDQVLGPNTPYIVDDTYWTLETHRLKLGKIVYSPKAKAYIQDPTNYRDWYKQNLRWMWGTFQGILGHRIGTQFNKFHMAYVVLIIEWIIYVLSAPFLIYVIFSSSNTSLVQQFALLFSGYGIWVVLASISLKRPRLLLFTPAILVVDFIFRFIMVHALIKAFQQRTVESCVWESPKRVAKT